MEGVRKMVVVNGGWEGIMPGWQPPKPANIARRMAREERGKESMHRVCGSPEETWDLAMKSTPREELPPQTTWDLRQDLRLP